MNDQNVTHKVKTSTLTTWLEENGFDVMEQDCGDPECGVTIDQQDNGDGPFTVLAVEDLDFLAAEADRLHDLCTQRGLMGPDSQVNIQATYVPGEPAVILLTGLTDAPFVGN